MNVIMKFGGTSVADADAMDRVIRIVRDQLDRNPQDKPPVVGVSAMSKVTDRLIETGRLAGIGEADAAAKTLGDLLERHLVVARSLVSGEALEKVNARLTEDFAALTADVRTHAARGEVTPRAHDALVAMGELASSRIVAAAFIERAVPAVWVDARKVLVTDNEHMAALPDMDTTLVRTQDLLGSRVAAGEVPVLGGFIGATASGVTTTLRGVSRRR